MGRLLIWTAMGSGLSVRAGEGLRPGARRKDRDADAAASGAATTAELHQD